MAKLTFNDGSLRDLPTPSGPHRIDYDEPVRVRGFALQTTYTGAKRFLLVYVAKATGRERRMVLGEFGKAPKLSVSAALRLAAEKRALVDLGRDPWEEGKEQRAQAVAASERQSASLDKLMAAYVAHLKAADKASWKEVQSAIKRHITPRKRLAAKAADEITVDDVMPVFHALTKAGKLREAEKLRAYMRAAYTAAKKARTDASMFAFTGFTILSNPLADLDVSRPREAADTAAKAAKERKWALSEAQLAAYWRRIAADESPGGALLRFHLLTGGQRIEQLIRLTDADYGVDEKAVTLRDTKGRRKLAHEHVVPLLPEAVRALESLRGDEGPYLLTLTKGKTAVSYHKIWEAMQDVVAAMIKEKEIDRAFTPGTIRKTVETRLAAKGVPDEVLARLLSHGLGGVQARNYNAHRYDDEKRGALRKLRALFEPKSKVIQFPVKTG